jgi:hypothetical protein
MSRAFILITGLTCLALAAEAAPDAIEKPLTFDQIVDRAIVQENHLLARLHTERPIAETYIQEMQPDADFGAVPKSDHYFLGKVDLSQGVAVQSFLPKSDTRTHAFQIFTHLFSLRYLPRGFAQMMLLDAYDFNRNEFNFEYVHREFLGDIRTIVVDVHPKAGAGRFTGQIWIEDKGYNIVRFNGVYGRQDPGQPDSGQYYLHFDSWRVNCGPNLWLPYAIYSEESSLGYVAGLRHVQFKGLTRLWGYTTAQERDFGEFTNVTVEMAAVEDKSSAAADNSPVESLRAWQRRAEDNVLDKMEHSNILARRGQVDKVLDTVVNNLVVTNNLNIAPEVRTRVILTTPLETFTVGHTIVISRGLLDTLPDEASLAAILAHELANIALGQTIDSKFAFSDRTFFDDEETLRRFRFARSQEQEDKANATAVAYLMNSPYKEKLGQAGLYLKALGNEANRLPALIKPLFGSRIAEGNNVLRMASLIERSPQLQTTRIDQIAALPLGSRTRLDPWTDDLRMTSARPVPLLSAREKMPFQLTPIYLHLTYEGHGELLAPREAARNTAGEAAQDTAQAAVQHP